MCEPADGWRFSVRWRLFMHTTPRFQHADTDLYGVSVSCTKFTYSCSAREILMSFFSRFLVRELWPNVCIWPCCKVNSDQPSATQRDDSAKRHRVHLICHGYTAVYSWRQQTAERAVVTRTKIRVRFHIIGHACIQHVGQYQSCTVSK